jgi:hypothetical protein
MERKQKLDFAAFDAAVSVPCLSKCLFLIPKGFTDSGMFLGPECPHSTIGQHAFKMRTPKRNNKWD